jgi:hypothetical protein
VEVGAGSRRAEWTGTGSPVGSAHSGRGWIAPLRSHTVQQGRACRLAKANYHIDAR